MGKNVVSVVHLRTGPAATICGYWNGPPNAAYVTGRSFTTEVDQVTCAACVEAAAAATEIALQYCAHTVVTHHSGKGGNDLVVCSQCGNIVMV